jgi:hypothetical protein
MPAVVVMAMQKEFTAAAATHFGSGWAWLVKKGDKLAIVSTHDAGNPLKDGSGTPLLTADVWVSHGESVMTLVLRMWCGLAECGRIVKH